MSDKKFILNADDFGMSKAFNTAVLASSFIVSFNLLNIDILILFYNNAPPAQ